MSDDRHRGYERSARLVLASGAPAPLQAVHARRSSHSFVLASVSALTVMLSIVLAWETFKDWLSAKVHLTHWDLHVILGLAFFLLAARLLRRPLTSFVPLIPVAVLELGNETLDFLRAWLPHWYWNWPDTLIEIALTLLPPLALVLLARGLPRLRHLAAAIRFRLLFPPRREHLHIKVKDDQRS